MFLRPIHTPGYQFHLGIFLRAKNNNEDCFREPLLTNSEPSNPRVINPPPGPTSAVAKTSILNGSQRDSVQSRCPRMPLDTVVRKWHGSFRVFEVCMS
ncbi:hypothetical protein CDV36_011715 [Fusarium kuroshium]|uniref:Uncharacterized protein n=1 Tax=Fusarium kuroshium TaxID=2010991 RepID=A0A3M2RTM0_9HYPO|nr:hypothetical protein CDV36_011715 [Fusarium kuroshium]